MSTAYVNKNLQTDADGDSNSIFEDPLNREKTLSVETAAKLKEIYFDPKNAGSFGGIYPLYAAFKRLHPDLPITTAQVQIFLRQQPAYQIHKPSRIRFPRRKFRVNRIDQEWEIDLGFLQKHSRWNNGYKYLLYCIDLLSKFMWVRPLKDKTMKTVTAAFKDILKDAAPRHPESVFSDLGSEFTGGDFQAMCKQEGIRNFTATNVATKAAAVERGIRTFMAPLARYMTANNTRRYIDVLPQMVERYNNHFHRSIGMTPTEASMPEHVQQALRNLYPAGDYVINQTNKYKYPVGGQVKLVISRANVPFYKAYEASWQPETFTIAERFSTADQPQYRLNDGNGNRVVGDYYEHELQFIGRGGGNGIPDANGPKPAAP